MNRRIMFAIRELHDALRCVGTGAGIEVSMPLDEWMALRDDLEVDALRFEPWTLMFDGIKFTGVCYGEVEITPAVVPCETWRSKALGG